VVVQSRYLLYFFIAILVFLPLPFGSNRPLYWWSSQLALHLLTATVLLSALLSSRVRLSAISPWHLGLMGLFLGIAGWPWLMGTSMDTSATATQWLKSISLFEVFFLALVLVSSRQKLKLLVTALVLAGTFQAVYGSLMTITGTDYIWNQPKTASQGVASGTFINRNHFAGYLEMCLALGLGLLIANLEDNRAVSWRQFFRRIIATLLGEKARTRIYLALMVIGLILSQSRMGNTAFFASMSISGLLGLLLFRNASRSVIILFASLLIIDIFLMGAFFGIDKVQQRLESTTAVTEERVVVNDLSKHIVGDHLWWGTGLGTYYTVFPQYRDERIGSSYIHAHNDLIEFPSELGLVGLAPLVLLMLSSFVVAIRLQVSNRSRLLRAMGFASSMAIIAIMLHSTTDFNLQVFANAATFMVILALPFICLNIDRADRGLPERRRSRTLAAGA